jgi:Common central domain of tyrosinase
MTDLGAIPPGSNSEVEAVPSESAEDESVSWFEREAKENPDKAQGLENLDEVRSQLFKLDGHLVEIRSLAGHDSLLIDGRREGYRASRAGYVLDRSGYSQPQPTLLTAASSALGVETTEQAPLYDKLAPLDHGDWEAGLLPCSRSNFVSLSDHARDRLACALNTLHDDGTVEEFVREHRSYGTQIHGGPAFLPWHRHFILRFEAELRRVDAQVRLPYWDWARTNVESGEEIDLTNDLEAEPWKSFFGGRANRGGQFDCWDYTRAPSPEGDLPTVAWIADTVDSEDFTWFRRIEGAHHGGVHSWVGGTMADPGQSPGDPLFFLHHANVDRLWAIWQRNHPAVAQYTLDSWPSENEFGGAFVPLDEPMAGGATPRSMLDHTALGVIYFERDPRLEARLPGYVTIDVPAGLRRPVRFRSGKLRSAMCKLGV